ncbi:MAG: histidinol-phosphatase HisJ [Candidatus Hodarchaeota archaeon]
MELEDWHTHSSFCRHAIGSLEDYVEKAIKLDLNLIGLSDHFPYEFLKGIEGIPYDEYAMKLDEIEQYLSTGEELKEVFNDRIEIKIAFELDYIENQAASYKRYLNKHSDRLDYILGSIHILQGKGQIFAFDDSRFLKNYELYGSITTVYLDYYLTLQKMIRSSEFDFDIIAHFDLPKKFNKKPENPELIDEQVIKTLELVKKKNLTIEINTSGLRKQIKEQYPSVKIIKIMYELDIPILLGSDAHHPDELGFNFSNMIKLLKEIGYDKLAYFEKRKRSFIEI